VNRIEIRGKVRFGGEAFAQPQMPLEGFIEVDGADPVVTIGDVLRTLEVAPDEGTEVRLTVEPATVTALVPRPPERGDLALLPSLGSLHVQTSAAMELRATLERCIYIEGNEERGWEVWVLAIEQAISLAGPRRSRRREAETDRRGLINGLVLALVPPRGGQ
jgi:hypothetical protein